MARKARLTALTLPVPARRTLAPDLQKYFARCDEKLGFVPNVLAAYSFSEDKLRAFMGLYNELMLAESGLSKLEREMVAVVVSSANRCHYCLTAHGAAVRELSGDPELGDTLVMNWRAAKVTPRQMAMFAFADRLTVSPEAIVESDRAVLRRAGLSDRDIWDLASVASFFNFTNRHATAVGMQPNAEYPGKGR